MRHTKTWVPVLVAVCLFGGFAWSSRNSSGTYTLPSGNPVVTGTVISSSWANNTLSDLATEVTNSLDRNGRGAMLAPLQLANGSASHPALTWASDLASGFHYIGTSAFDLDIAGAPLFAFSATNQALTCQASTTGSCLTITASTANATGLTVTAGSGGGAGVIATGSSAGGTGVIANGAVNGSGTVSTGAGNGSGITATGGSNGTGGTFTAGGGNNIGVLATGSGSGVSGVGVSGMPGTAATAATRQYALQASMGDLQFINVTNPFTDAGFPNTLAAANIPKAAAQITIASGSTGVCSIKAGFNIISCSVPTPAAGLSPLTIVLNAPMASSNYVVVATGGTVSSPSVGQIDGVVTARSTSQFTVDTGTGNGGGTCYANGCDVNILVFGAQ